MNKVFATLIISLAIFAFAAYEDWLSYESNPFGVFLYTPNDWCAPRTHSFSVTYELILIVTGITATVIALTARLIFYFFQNSVVKRWSKHVSHLSFLIVLALSALFLITPIFESLQPLQLDSACKELLP